MAGVLHITDRTIRKLNWPTLLPSKSCHYIQWYVHAYSSFPIAATPPVVSTNRYCAWFQWVWMFQLLWLRPFQMHLTLFSKYFATFPRGTCLLSNSSFLGTSDTAYYLICTRVPESTTPQKGPRCATSLDMNRIFTFPNVFSIKLFAYWCTGTDSVNLSSEG